MNSDMFQGQWAELAETLPTYFTRLSEEDVAAIAGDGDQLVRLLHDRYGYNDEQAQDAWDRFMRRHGRA